MGKGNADLEESLHRYHLEVARQYLKDSGGKITSLLVYHMARDICLYKWSAIPDEVKQGWKNYARALLIEAKGSK